MRSEYTLLSAAAALLALLGLAPSAGGLVAAPTVPATVAADNSVVPVAGSSMVGAERREEEIRREEIALEKARRIEVAVEALSRYVRRQSHPEALEYAVRAYHNYRAAFPNEVRKPYLYFVDFGLDSSTPRGYVFDMDALALVEGPFMVAHGRGSVTGGSNVPTRFLNTKDSNATSLGLYVAQETYAFRGRSGGRAYRSIGLRLRGVSGQFNSAARARGIVVHGAPYVTERKAGRSEGCPAMPLHLAEKLIPKIANGGLVFHFSPHDSRWMREDPWAGASSPRVAIAD